ncbi:hypothetical protein SERLA73DRAFT_174774, partial [Serpula lacrymans var. lacrymans S7.3]
MTLSLFPSRVSVYYDIDFASDAVRNGDICSDQREFYGNETLYTFEQEELGRPWSHLQRKRAVHHRYAQLSSSPIRETLRYILPR